MLFFTGDAVTDRSKQLRMEALLMGLFGNKGVSKSETPAETASRRNNAAADTKLYQPDMGGIRPKLDPALRGKSVSARGRDVCRRQRP